MKKENSVSVFQKFSAALKRIYYSEDLEDTRGLKGALAYFVRYMFHIFGELRRDQCFLRASALTFTTVMTLIPILVLVFVIFRAFGGLAEYSNRVQQFLFKHMLPESVASAESFIDHLLQDFNTQAVSYISIIFLIGAAFALFDSVDSSLNSIWGVSRIRGFFQRLVTIWFILTVTPVLLGYSLYLTARLENVPGMGNAVILTGFAIFRRLTPFLLTTLSLTLLYKTVPRTRVTWSSAFIGGCFAGIFWEGTKYGFNYYVQNLANFKILYGSFLTLPIFLIWVDFSWLIILAGAEVAYTHQNLGRLHLLRKRRKKAREEHELLPDKLGVFVYLLIADSFLKNDPLDRNTIINRSPGQAWMIDALLERFHDEGHIAIDTGGSVVPSRDLSTVKIRDIFSLFEPSAPGEYFRLTAEPLETVDRLLSTVRQFRDHKLRDLDVRTLLITGNTPTGN